MATANENELSEYEQKYPNFENMLGYQQRVVSEKCELDIKIEKLEKYLASSPSIGRVALKLLQMQCDTMKQYTDILDMRISIF